MTTDPYAFRARCDNCGATFTATAYGPGITLTEGNREKCTTCGHWQQLPYGAFSDLKPREPPESGPRDLKYLDANPYFGSDDEILSKLGQPSVKTTELSAPVASFLANISRLRSMLNLPARLIHVSMLRQKLASEALLEVTGDLKKEPSGDDQWRELRDKADTLWNNWFATCSPERLAQDAKTIGDANVASLIQFGSGPTWLGFDAILIGQITGAWTSFEALAGDLWEAALNAHPHFLSDLKGKRQKSTDAPGCTEQSKQSPKGEDPGKSIAVGILQRYKYDLSRCMGSVLKSKFDFTSLGAKNGIKSAYWAAFGDQNIGSIIEGESLRSLASVRNVIVHKAGMVDEEFKGDLSAIPPFRSIGIGKRIPIDGALVQDLIHPVVNSAIDLIRSVDNWIVEHP